MWYQLHTFGKEIRRSVLGTSLKLVCWTYFQARDLGVMVTTQQGPLDTKGTTNINGASDEIEQKWSPIKMTIIESWNDLS